MPEVCQEERAPAVAEHTPTPPFSVSSVHAAIRPPNDRRRWPCMRARTLWATGRGSVSKRCLIGDGGMMELVRRHTFFLQNLHSISHYSTGGSAVPVSDAGSSTAQLRRFPRIEFPHHGN